VKRPGAVAAAAVLLLGTAFCFVMYWWQLRYRYAFHDPTGNLLLAIPFAGLAAMVAGGMRRVAAALGWVVLAVMTGSAYIEAAKSSSSTAPVLYLAPFFYGAIVLSILFAVDSILRARREGRRAPRPR
jgi:hypothetical protein